MNAFSDGILYLEVGGHLLHDGHASRVLPGFDPSCKIKILKALDCPFDVLFCMSTPDMVKGRVWVDNETYEETMWRVLASYSEAGLPKPKIVLNLYEDHAKVQALEGKLKEQSYEIIHRYAISGYPQDVGPIVSSQGYGKDEHSQTSTKLVIVTGLGSNCGKLSTCMGQAYLDRERRGLTSGYAKYELFPFWKYPVEHPVNLAYEAATADIGDFNVVDAFHKEAYNVETVNYNRDVDAFPILRKLIDHIAAPGSVMHATYKSPTDMGLNTAWQGVVDEAVCIQAAIVEIENRQKRYQALVDKGCGEPVDKVTGTAL
mmetsp:Transcript_21916/g.52141  ORF Transcript_21916/g.52141 Transcript_21916/m.52141 type:complete len:316 (-) Transcript_21916:114-1061(-)